MHVGRIVTLATACLALAGCRHVDGGPSETPIAAIDPLLKTTHFEATGPKTILGNDAVTPASAQEVSAQPTTIMTLPQAVQETVLANLRVRAKGEKIAQAEADFTTASLIPNAQLFADYQLVPLQHTDINNQAGPPQWDALVTVPIDWLLFGKRVAAMAATNLGVDVAQADYADVLRKAISDTVQAWYDLLEARELAALAQEDLTDLERIEEITKKQVELGGAGSAERDRVRLAVLDARREARQRAAAAAAAKAKLRPLLGRSAPDADFEVRGVLTVKTAVPAPTLEEAVALAERQRPDLLSDRRAIAQGRAGVARELALGKPQVPIQTGLNYQVQRRITGFPDTTLFAIGLNTTLPFTDRNQGNVAKAGSLLRQSELTYKADLADVRSEIEQALTAYRTATIAVTEDDPSTLEVAKNLRDKTEAAYKVGGRRLLELLDAQRAYRDRVRASVSNSTDFWQSLYKLNAATGSLRGAGPDITSP